MAGAASKTINLEVGTLRAVLRRHRLWASMQPDVKMMAVKESPGKAITDEEEQQRPEVCRNRRSRTLLPVVMTALHTGMRRGEIQSLQWHQIDFLSRSLRVGSTKTAAGSGKGQGWREPAPASWSEEPHRLWWPPSWAGAQHDREDGQGVWVHRVRRSADRARCRGRATSTIWSVV